MNDLQPIEPQAQPLSTMDLIHYAIEKGADADQLAKLMDLKERNDKAIAVQEFNKAFAAFKEAAPAAIMRTGRVGYDGKGGSRTEYSHVELDHAVNVLVPLLARYNLSHRWETVNDNAMITVTCYLEHMLGHCRKSTLAGPPDTSGNKNPIQAIGSATSYLERYTFLAVTGMAATGQDDDGRSQVKDIILASEDQRQQVRDAIEQKLVHSEAKVLAFLQPSIPEDERSIDKITQRQFTLFETSFLKKHKGA